ncbi:mannitol dehydrogenase family protein [Saccharopolyspora erythraea]|uniref:mannitol dehydrogenase family protein n=1 Tax=Saccharopolyspora erythraea TaxID=1836 RepID=UPI001BED5ED9|nr:mannitol dehydrogenase family protein [Saccharopolyspora erythraea]QUH04146.1 mannitol dehydrogenase family protein [Saccharopolyspora erythraea]
MRAVHLGLGAFHRAHQAVYTMADPEWGIAAYTFRNTELPRRLAEQDGLYSLQVRGDGEPQAEIVDAISRAHAGSDTDQWLADLASPDVALLTLTITEAGYRVSGDQDGTAIGRLLAGLRGRHRAGGAPIALVPCDNLPGNGGVLRRAIGVAAQAEGPGFRSWIEDNVSFVDTVVDRITPAVTEQDVIAAARLTGLEDRAPVVTEPFSEWLLAGDFPLGRPAWEKSGARFVDDLAAYEQRKLWFLNGAHTLLAYAGPALGCATVDEAVRHPVLARLTESWWDVAARHAPLPAQDLTYYRERLLQRFSSRGVRHNLLQIAADGSQKIPARILPVLRAERAAERMPEAPVAALAGWLIHLRDRPVSDPRADELVALARSADAPRRVLSALDITLADDGELVSAVEDYVEHLRLSTG